MSTENRPYVFGDDAWRLPLINQAQTIDSRILWDSDDDNYPFMKLITEDLKQHELVGRELDKLLKDLYSLDKKKYWEQEASNPQIWRTDIYCLLGRPVASVWVEKDDHDILHDFGEFSWQFVQFHKIRHYLFRHVPDKGELARVVLEGSFPKRDTRSREIVPEFVQSSINLVKTEQDFNQSIAWRENTLWWYLKDLLSTNQQYKLRPDSNTQVSFFFLKDEVGNSEGLRLDFFERVIDNQIIKYKSQLGSSIPYWLSLEESNDRKGKVYTLFLGETVGEKIKGLDLDELPAGPLNRELIEINAFDWRKFIQIEFEQDLDDDYEFPRVFDYKNNELSLERVSDLRHMHHTVKGKCIDLAYCLRITLENSDKTLLVAVGKNEKIEQLELVDLNDYDL